MAVCMALALLAGCAEVEDQEPTDGATGDGIGTAQPNVSGLSGRLVADVENLTVSAGVPFNVTLGYEGDNATDTAGLAWQVSFSNATGNATDATNPVTYNGTGLPASFRANITLLGNVTMTGIASQGNDTVALGPIALVVEALDLALADPCAGAGPQDAVTASGSTLLPGDVGRHDIEVGPCQTRIHVAVDILVGGDMDFYLFDPSGSERDGSAAFGAEGVASESDLDFQDAAGLEVGTWAIEIENFASLATDYDITVTFD